MCMFSQPVTTVADTRIFARGSNGRQVLAYQMRYAAAGDLAMVLPLPVPPASPEDAVAFVNLKGYEGFFEDLAAGFPEMVGDFHSLGRPRGRSVAPKLVIHDVGDFEASFVPALEDFDRLDERFRIPPKVWDALPAYRNFGFAVFRLKGTEEKAGGLRGLLGGRERRERVVHPMAFEFPRRNPDLLYFPTLHVHDRTTPERAVFDHVLYCQADTGMAQWLDGWEQSVTPAAFFVDVTRSKGLVLADRHCWRLPLRGLRSNQDTLVGKEGAVPVGA